MYIVFRHNAIAHLLEYSILCALGKQKNLCDSLFCSVNFIILLYYYLLYYL